MMGSQTVCCEPSPSTNTKDVRSSVRTVFVCSFPNSQDVGVMGCGENTMGTKGSSQLVGHFLLVCRKFAEK